MIAWKSEKENELLIKKQLFDKKEGKKNRKLQRELVEKKIAADERLQKYLNKSNQEFQGKLEAIKRDTQLTIAEFTKKMDALIAEDNRQFQTWLFFEQRQLQEELAEYNRETQLQVAIKQKENAIELSMMNEAIKAWPLKLMPPQILQSYPKDKIAPLRVITALPDIFYDNSGNNPFNHKERVEYDISAFIGKHYSPQSTSSVKFLSDAWKGSKQVRQQTAAEILNDFLYSEPLLFLDSQMDNKYFYLRLTYWNGSQKDIYHQPTVFRISYGEYLKKWATERTGAKSEKISYIIEDYEKFSKFIATCHCLLIGFFADFHYQLLHGIAPKFSSYLSELYDSFPDDETRQLMFDHFMKSQIVVNSII